MIRGRFEFAVVQGERFRFEMAGSEWWLFNALRRISKAGEQLAWFESAGCPLVPASLAALNCYLRTRAMLRWRSGRFDQDSGAELIGVPEWRRFCRLLGLRFDGPGTRVVRRPLPALFSGRRSALGVDLPAGSSNGLELSRAPRKRPPGGRG